MKYLIRSWPEDHSFLKTLLLAQLLAWMILDQGSGNRETRKSAGAERRSKLPNAASAGRYVLALLLDRQQKLKRHDETNTLLNELVTARRLVRGLVWATGSRQQYNDARAAERELHYVYWIISYLCRCKQHGLDANKFTIETAKQYIAQWGNEGKRTYGVSRIEKIWLKYRHAAPFIFGFYSFLRGLRHDVGSPKRLLESFEKLALNEQLLTQLIGRAAYAADVLQQVVPDDLEMSDFTDIPRVPPPLRSFGVKERMVIESIDRKAAIAS